MAESHEATIVTLIQTLTALGGTRQLASSSTSFKSLSSAFSTALLSHPYLLLSHTTEMCKLLNEAIHLRDIMGFAHFATVLRAHVILPIFLSSTPFSWPVMRVLLSSELVMCPRRLEVFVHEMSAEASMLQEKTEKFLAKYATRVGGTNKENLVSFSPSVMNRTIMYGKALVPRVFFLSTFAIYSQNPSVNRVLALGGKIGYATRIPLTSLTTIEGVCSAFGFGNQAIKIGCLEGDSEPTTYVFPELIGSQRRDEWLRNIREIAAAHAFIEQCRLWVGSGTPREKRLCWSETQENMVLAIARENIIRFHAAHAVVNHELLAKGSPSSPQWQLGFSGTLLKYRDPKAVTNKQSITIGVWEIVDINAAKAVMTWLCCSDTTTEERMHAAMQALWTQNIVSMHNEEKKADATFTDMPRALSLMQTLVEPLRQAAEYIPPLLTWEKKELTGAVCVGCVLLAIFDLVQYMPAIIVMSQALIMMHLYVLKHRGKKFPVLRPERQKQPLVARVIRARQRMQKVQELMNTINHTLLVLRALYTSESPWHTTAAICALIIAGLVLAFVPGRFLFLLLATHLLTCKLAFRKESMRRVRKSVRTYFEGIPIVALEDPEAEEFNN